MASTRSNATTRRAAGSGTAGTPTTAVLTLVRGGAHIQIAAWTTAAKMLAEWAQSADRLAQAVGDELLRRVNGETDSAGLAARVTAASSTHLRELTALPRAAADHFDTRLLRVPIDN
jgi:hypothetical protein